MTTTRTPATRNRTPKPRRPPPPASGWGRQHHKTPVQRTYNIHLGTKPAPARRRRRRPRPSRRGGIILGCVGAAFALVGLAAIVVEGTAWAIYAETSWVSAGLSAGLAAWQLKHAPPPPPKTTPMPKPASAGRKDPNCPCQCRVHGQPGNGKRCNCTCKGVNRSRSGSGNQPPRRRSGPPPPNP